jgi:hypothetical protein
MDVLFAKSTTQRPSLSNTDEQAGEAVLSVCVSDAGWTAELRHGEIVRWKQRASSVVEAAAASPADQLAQVVARLSAEQPQARVTRLVLLIDDPELQLVDHRFAKLNNFEPRAIKEFGSQQAGGRPIAFGSLAFGPSSAREMEKRVLAFLPEDRLEHYFFALGKMATALAAVVPAGANALAADSHEGGVFATLRVHGYFSTLLIANAQTGIVAMRQFPFGALTLAKAYAAEHGLSLAQASAALASRTRLPPASSVKLGAAPEHKTGTYAALSPLLREMHDEIAATIEYFRFQRLAGRPVHLALTFTGPALAGLEGWLANALELQVDAAEIDLSPLKEPTEPALNLLEGSRAGVLKMGNQPFEFSGGRFLPMKGVQSDMAPKKSASSFSLPWLDTMTARLGKERIVLRREQLMAGAAALGSVTLLVIANLYFLTGPAEQHLADGASAYDTAVAGSIAAARATGGEAGLPERQRPVLWAENLFELSQSLLPAMKIEHLELGAGAGKAGAGSDLSLTITGALPPGSLANLKTVAGFIDGLNKQTSFSRRFSQLRFTGAGQSTDETHHEMIFHIAALSGSAAR